MTELTWENSEFVTALSVSLTLRFAGHSRSEEHTTAIRGYHKFTSGYVAEQAGRGVLVRYRNHSDRLGTLTAEDLQGILTGYAATLRRKGFEVVVHTDGVFAYKPAFEEAAACSPPQS